MAAPGHPIAHVLRFSCFAAARLCNSCPSALAFAPRDSTRASSCAHDVWSTRIHLQVIRCILLRALGFVPGSSCLANLSHHGLATSAARSCYVLPLKTKRWRRQLALKRRLSQNGHGEKAVCDGVGAAPCVFPGCWNWIVGAARSTSSALSGSATSAAAGFVPACCPRASNQGLPCTRAALGGLSPQHRRQGRQDGRVVFAVGSDAQQREDACFDVVFEVSDAV